MKNKLKYFWNKIKLDYNENPIGSLKTEIMMWLTVLYFCTLYTTSFETLFILGYDIFYISSKWCILLTIMIWIRLALKLNIFIKD